MEPRSLLSEAEVLPRSRRKVAHFHAFISLRRCLPSFAARRRRSLAWWRTWRAGRWRCTRTSSTTRRRAAAAMRPTKTATAGSGSMSNNVHPSGSCRGSAAERAVHSRVHARLQDTRSSWTGASKGLVHANARLFRAAPVPASSQRAAHRLTWVESRRDGRERLGGAPAAKPPTAARSAGSVSAAGFWIGL